MLGTFPFELWFKSYRCFTVGSLEFLEIAKLPLSSTSTPLLCFAPPPTDGTDAGAVERLLGRLFPSRCRPRVAPEPPPSLLGFALALSLPCHAPRTSSRPPPRRRRGELAAEPQDPFQRAHEHLKDPSDLFLSFFCSLRAPRPRNTTAAIRRTPVSPGRR